MENELKKERLTQWQKGFDDAIEGVLQVLQVGLETYPRVPSEVTLKMFMPPEIAVKIFDAIDNYQEAMANEAKRRMAAEGR
jgi:hypothetical protein